MRGEEVCEGRGREVVKRHVKVTSNKEGVSIVVRRGDKGADMLKNRLSQNGVVGGDIGGNDMTSGTRGHR